MLNSSWFQWNNFSVPLSFFACLRFCWGSGWVLVLFGFGLAFLFSYGQMVVKTDKQGFKRFQKNKDYVCPLRIVSDSSGFPDHTVCCGVSVVNATDTHRASVLEK